MSSINDVKASQSITNGTNGTNGTNDIKANRKRFVPFALFVLFVLFAIFVSFVLFVLTLFRHSTFRADDHAAAAATNWQAPGPLKVSPKGSQGRRVPDLIHGLFLQIA